MMHFSEPVPVFSTSDAPAGHVRLAAAAYLGRFKGSSREHTESDLRCYLTWCAKRGLDPLAARRADLELYIRWMQQIRRFGPSTVSRRFSVAAGFCRTRVIDAVLGHSPAEHVPPVGAARVTHARVHPPSVRSPADRRASPRTGMTSRWWPCSGCWACGSSKPPAPISATWAFLIGQAIRERRLALGLSQTELTARAGMTQPALSRLEAGGVVPTIPLLERISIALDADLIVEIAPHAA
jgi:DNA-binding Xre family transcriptional regulator